MWDIGVPSGGLTAKPQFPRSFPDTGVNNLPQAPPFPSLPRKEVHSMRPVLPCRAGLGMAAQSLRQAWAAGGLQSEAFSLQLFWELLEVVPQVQPQGLPRGTMSMPPPQGGIVPSRGSVGGCRWDGRSPPAGKSTPGQARMCCFHTSLTPQCILKLTPSSVEAAVLSVLSIHQIMGQGDRRAPLCGRGAASWCCWTGSQPGPVWCHA